MPHRIRPSVFRLCRRGLRTLFRWLKRDGYRPERRYMRGRTQSHTS
ncbi:hypothetical protein ACFOD4_07760 [Pseudoroseomonas globiformis]|uniref:Uncharacterized protein n=1 Tax=Teichococcus globiformis TaxID=2307229 RepID=A0ABV7FZY7_9PROT